MAEHLPAHSILESLRPDPGWQTDSAILSTYSLDLYCAVAVLLSLGGVVDDSGSAAAHELAATLESLSDRVRILAQRGRITAPDHFPSGLGILDRFVEEQPLDERTRSWHPKLALVRYVHGTSQERAWRCWVGSRNFTRAANWDLGVLFTGVTGKGRDGLRIRGIKDGWARLADRLQRPLPGAGELAQELDGVTWASGAAGSGIKAAELRLMLPEDPGRGFPDELNAEFEDLWIVSPFLGKAAVEAAGRWGGTAARRILVSTSNDLRKIAAIAPSELEKLGDLRLRDSASEAQTWLPGDEEDRADHEDSLEELSGLHAKFIAARRGESARLWLGSPNLTRRGWQSNAEAVFRLEVDAEVLTALKVFLDQARSVTVEELSEEAPDEETELESARRDLSAISDLRQKRQEAGSIVFSESLGRLVTTNLAVSVGLLGASTELVSWPQGADRVVLPRAAREVETELLRVRLRAGNEKDECILFAPLDPPPGDERDRAAIASLLRPSGLLRWLAGLLDPAFGPSLEGETWEQELMGGSSRGMRGRLAVEGLTLEAILRAWTRDPERIVIARRRADRYLAAVLDTAGDKGGEELEELKRFERTWQVVSDTLQESHD